MNQTYYVIYEKWSGIRREDQEVELKVIGCRDKEVAAKQILDHPEATVIYGERINFSIVPQRVEWIVPVPQCKECGNDILACTSHDNKKALAQWRKEQKEVK